MIGVLLVTHAGIGTAMIAVANALLRNLPLKVEAFEVPYDVDPETLLPRASAALRRVDDGYGVLVLTDLYGATPSNLAARLARLGTPVRRVSALSLPMLLRGLNYAEMELDGLPAGGGALGHRRGGDRPRNVGVGDRHDALRRLEQGHPERVRELAHGGLGGGAVEAHLPAEEPVGVDPAEIRVQPQSKQNSVRYFTDWALPQLDMLIDETSDPIDVFTTLDPGMQAVANRAVNAYTPAGAQGALVALDRDGHRLRVFAAAAAQ